MTGRLADAFREHHRSLVRMLYRRTGDLERAEELAQEAFARAVATPPTDPRPWLFAVALNLVREEGRTAATRQRRLELLKGELAPSAPSPADEYEQEERRGRVRRALLELTERDRDALLLHAEGFDYDEIAATLGLARGSVGTTLARARRRLVEAYGAVHGAAGGDDARTG